MDTFVQLTDEEKRITFDEASARLGLPAASVEKDFWVCWTLKVLFGLDGIGDSLVFKGGTSLSKAYKLIERFSEDIDVVIDRERLGFGGDHSPEEGGTPTQTKKRLKALKKACHAFIWKELEPSLRQAISRAEVSEFELSADENDKDDYSILFAYPSVYPELVGGYLRRAVKIELGARSDTWPVNHCDITPYAADALTDYFHEPSCRVSTIAAERTCLDKMFLLHEENGKPAEKTKKERMSRHYYDLFKLIEAGVANRAIRDEALLERPPPKETLNAFPSYVWEG